VFSYDPRVQSVSTSLVRIFQKAGLDFGILGKKESCCGNEIRRMGEEALFKKLAKDNTALFKKSGIKQIITSPLIVSTPSRMNTRIWVRDPALHPGLPI
jgi:Fe-S oxidoreductase